jgi:hypothetical protein
MDLPRRREDQVEVGMCGHIKYRTVRSQHENVLRQHGVGAYDHSEHTSMLWRFRTW